ncbi:MAG: ABC transporter ATP-binding protein [Candidatus Hodarchaeales archaeon]
MLLETKNVSSGYEKAIIVNDVSLYVEKGEMVTIIGPNGSGKSTLMKTILGYLKPYSGQIFYDSVQIDKLDVHKIIKLGIGFVPQLDNVFSKLTVLENLEMGAYLDLEDMYEFDELFDLFPALIGRENEKAGNLSGGEKQMLAIARAMITKPKLLCLDEPTAALAPNLAKEIFLKLQEIRESGISILLIEQNAIKSLKISDRGYVLAIGKKVHEGKASELLNSPEIQKHYLGVKSE